MHVPPNRHPRSEQNLTSSGNLFMLVILIKICLDVSWGVQVSLKDDILGRGTKQSGVFWGLERRKRGLWEQALEEDVGLPVLSCFSICFLPTWSEHACIHPTMIPCFPTLYLSFPHGTPFPNPAYIILYTALLCHAPSWMLGLKAGVTMPSLEGGFLYFVWGFFFLLYLFRFETGSQRSPQ